MQYHTQGDQESPSLLRRMPSIHRPKNGFGNTDKSSEMFTPTESFHEPSNTIQDESSQTLTNSSDTEQQFDKIATKVNETIKDLGTIYSQIGYSKEETAEKKSEIFQVINDTVSSFKHSLQREKETIENECEWLRQQIRIILAMLDDTRGEKTLRQSHRGIVFNDETLLRGGYEEDVYQKLQQQENNMELDFDSLILTNGSTRRHMPQEGARTFSFPTEVSDSSQFNHDFSSDSVPLQQQYEYVISQKLPKPSLFLCKTKLNSIFLEVLKAFVKIFTKFNELNRLLWENVDAISENYQNNSGPSILASIPDKATAEDHSRLIEDFYVVLDKLNLMKRNISPDSSLDGRGWADDENAFIISSPRKQKMGFNEPLHRDIELERDEWMNRLRDTNYNIVRIIRSLKITKMTNDVILTLSKEIENTEREIQRRTKDMKYIIKECLSTIKVLSLSEKDIISLQRMQEQKKDTLLSASSDGFFDIETLHFIETNPREFGILDHHLNFITKLANTLEALKEARQKKWDSYHDACQKLWERLHESEEFMLLFLAANSNLSERAIINFKMELKRLHLKRSEYVENFILDSRKQIQQLQSKLLYSENQCRQFKYYAYDINEDVVEDKETILNEHEAEIEQLKEEYSAKEPILSLYSQLNELIEDQKFLVESSKDSSRLLSKNSCKILLNEEKIRKKISRNLPRVLASLKQEIIAFNNALLSEGKRTISVDGTDLFEKVLLIESSCGSGSGARPKPQLAKKTQPVRSPTKRPFGASKSSSPIKSARSPSKVTKLNNRPASNSFQKSASRPAMRPTSIGDENSPSKNSADLSLAGRFSPVAPPQNGSQGPTHLRPLQSPLMFASEVTGDHFEDESAGNTLYSTCSRTSPLRSKSNNSSFGNVPFSAKHSGSEYLRDISDDENKENPLAKIRNQLTASRFDAPRLSSGSLANSTIMGDDYQSWREERIKQMNHDF